MFAGRIEGDFAAAIRGSVAAESRGSIPSVRLAQTRQTNTDVTR